MNKITLNEFKKATNDYDRRDMINWILDNCDRAFIHNIMADHIESRTVLRELSDSGYLFDTVIAYSYGHDLKAGEGNVYAANEINFSWEDNS